MSNCCNLENKHFSPIYKKILWVVLGLNLSMFMVEIFAGVKISSVSLMADAMDFLSDSGNYIITLAVLGMSLKIRAKATLLKGISMAIIGFWVLGNLVYYLLQGSVPDAPTMGIIAFLALLANIISALLLFKFKAGDSNMRSVWICSRNDAINNIAVMLAAIAVYSTGHGWPDLLVALIMATLSLQGAWVIIKSSLVELRQG